MLLFKGGLPCYHFAGYICTKTQHSLSPVYEVSFVFTSDDDATSRISLRLFGSSILYMQYVVQVTSKCLKRVTMVRIISGESGESIGNAFDCVQGLREVRTKDA